MDGAEEITGQEGLEGLEGSVKDKPPRRRSRTEFTEETLQSSLPLKRKARRREPYLPVVIEETEDDILEAEGLLERSDDEEEDEEEKDQEERNQLDLPSISTSAAGKKHWADVSADFDDILRLFQHRINSSEKEGAPPLMEALAKQLQSPKARDRLTVAKYLDVVAIYGEEAAASFGKAKGLENMLKVVKSSDELMEYVPNMLASLCVCEENRKAAMKGGILQVLIKGTRRGVDKMGTEQCEAIAHAIAMLSFYEDARSTLQPAVDTMIEFCTHPSGANQYTGAGLCMLTCSDALQSMLVYKDGLRVISEAILSTNVANSAAQAWLASTLANLARNPMNAKAMSGPHVLEVLHTISLSHHAGVRKNAAWTFLFLSLHKGLMQAGRTTAWMRDMLLLSLKADQETLNVLQLAFAHFAGIDRQVLRDSPAVRQYMEAYTARQDEIREHALQSVYHILGDGDSSLDELVNALVHCACGRDAFARRDTLWLLGALFLDPRHCKEMQRLGGLRPLVLSSCLPHEDLQKICAQALVRVSLDKNLLYKVQEDQPVCGLLLLAGSRDQEVRRSSLIALWLLSMHGRDSPELAAAIQASCMDDVSPVQLEVKLKERMQPLMDSFQAKHSSDSDDQSSAGIECLAALARDATPDAQGRVAVRLRELARRGSILAPLAQRCLIRTMLALQKSAIGEVQSSVVAAWQDLCADAAMLARSDIFSVQCGQALLRMIINPETDVDRRSQSVTLLAKVLDSEQVCQHLGELYPMQQLMACQDPEWGVDSVSLWVILFKVLASPLCANASSLLRNHLDTMRQALDAEEHLDVLAKPMVRFMVRCAAWPVVLDELLQRGALFVKLLRRGLREEDEQILALTCQSLVQTTMSISEDRYKAMAEHYADLVDTNFEVIAFASKGATATNNIDFNSTNASGESVISHNSERNRRAIMCQELMHLAAKVLASLSNRSEVREIIEEHGYLDMTVLQTFLALPYPAVLVEVLLLLNNCCRSEALAADLATEAVLKPLVKHANKSEEPGVLVQIARLWHRFAMNGAMLSLLREDSAVDTIFAIIKKGPPAAQELAIQAVYHLAADSEVKRAIVRRGMLEFLCNLAEGGPISVQPHAAWLIASLLVRGDGRDLMYQRNTLEVLTHLLRAKNPQVVTRAAWALSQLPQLEEVVVRLVSVGAVPLLSGVLGAKDASGKAQGARTIGSLAWSESFRSEAASAGVLKTLSGLLAQENSSPAVHAAVARAMSEFLHRDEAFAKSCLQEGTAQSLVKLLGVSNHEVRSAALSATVPLLSLGQDARVMLDAGVLRVILQEGVATQKSDPDFQLSLARTMRLLASNDAAKAEFREVGGLTVLLELSVSDEPAVQEEVAWAVGALASDPDTETELAEAGAVDALQGYLLAASDAVRRRAQWSLGVLTPDCLAYAEAVRARRAEAGESPQSKRSVSKSSVAGASNHGQDNKMQPSQDSSADRDVSALHATFLTPTSHLSPSSEAHGHSVDGPHLRFQLSSESDGSESEGQGDDRSLTSDVSSAPRQQTMGENGASSGGMIQNSAKKKGVTKFKSGLKQGGASTVPLPPGPSPAKGERPRPAKMLKNKSEVSANWQRTLAGQAAVKDVKDMISQLRDASTGLGHLGQDLSPIKQEEEEAPGPNPVVAGLGLRMNDFLS